MRDWADVRLAGRGLSGFGLGVWADDVDAAIAELDPYMVSINSGVGACTTMAASDAQLWATAYETWQKVKSDWAFDKAGSVAPGPVYGSSILARVQSSNNDAGTFQAKLASACKSLAPPAPPPTTGTGGNSQTPSLTDDLKNVGAVLGKIAVGGVVLYGVFKGIQLVSGAAKVA